MKKTTIRSLGVLALSFSAGASAITSDPGPPPTATFNNVIVRDFRGDGQGPDAHPDFDNDGTTNGIRQTGQPNGVVAGMVGDTLDSNGKLS